MAGHFISRIVPGSINRSLRAKVTIGIILPMILMLGVFIFFEYTHHRTVLLNNMTALAAYNGKVINESLLHSMLESDFTEVQRILDAVGKDGNFRVVYVLDTSGRVIFSPDNSGKNLQLNNQEPACQTCHRLKPGERPNGVVVTADNGQQVFRSMQPIENSPACAACHDPQERIIGLLLTDISVAPFEGAFIADLRENLLLGGSTILVSALFAYWIMGKLIIRRLDRVADALTGFGSANHDEPLGIDSPDEIGKLAANFDDMKTRIQAEELENQTLSEHLRHQANQQQELLKQLISAQEDERKRVARELHDELGQSLSGLALQSEIIEKFIPTDPERALTQLSQSKKLIGRTTQQMYELILALRPSVLDDLGLAAALKIHAERALTGITFTLDAKELTHRLPPEIETVLYRIFQEGLSNVIKHSGADHVTIRLAQRDSEFYGVIADNGRGFNLEDIERQVDNPQGLGLLGMQERLSLCGGSMKIISRRGKGTRIEIIIPQVKYE